MKKFPINTLKRLAKELKVRRLSKDAIEELQFFIEEYSRNILEMAKEIMINSKRKTLKKEDIRIVIK
ncbi:MAG: NFYB/HAP3 family transcription factor subunit [Candidatus Aenigmatarchaeota archaeon]|nr:NFYB/HAP3 family transcription factor subunit [Candidatus Aenigmarchaeota archaeon]